MTDTPSDPGGVRAAPDLSGDVERQFVDVEGTTVEVRLTARCSTCGGPIFTTEPRSYATGPRGILAGRSAAYGTICWTCVNRPR